MSACEVRGCPRPGLHKRWIVRGKAHESVIMCGPCLAKATDDGAELLDAPPPLVGVRPAPNPKPAMPKPTTKPACAALRCTAAGRPPVGLCSLHNDYAVGAARGLIGNAWIEARDAALERMRRGEPLEQPDAEAPARHPGAVAPKKQRKPYARKATPQDADKPVDIPANPDPAPLLVDEPAAPVPAPTPTEEAPMPAPAAPSTTDRAQLDALGEAERRRALLTQPSPLHPHGDALPADGKAIGFDCLTCEAVVEDCRPIRAERDPAPLTLAWVATTAQRATLTVRLGRIALPDLARVDALTLDGSLVVEVATSPRARPGQCTGRIEAIPSLPDAEAILAGVLAPFGIVPPAIPAEVRDQIAPASGGADG